MTNDTERITPRADCKACHGDGIIYERHPYGSTTAEEALYCDCVIEQLEDPDADIAIVLSDERIEAINAENRAWDAVADYHDDFLMIQYESLTEIDI